MELAATAQGDGGPGLNPVSFTSTYPNPDASSARNPTGGMAAGRGSGHGSGANDKEVRVTFADHVVKLGRARDVDEEIVFLHG